MNVRPTIIAVFGCCALLSACTSEPPLVPEPAELAVQEVPAGSARVVVRHAGDQMTLDHVQAVQRDSEIKVVLTQSPIESSVLSDPFEEFSVDRWARRNQPQVRPILVFDMGPDRKRTLNCRIYGHWDMMLEGDSCSFFESSLSEVEVTGSTLSANVDVIDPMEGNEPERAWRASGQLQAPIVKLEPLPAITGKEAIDSPQLARFMALEAAFGAGTMSAIQPHMTPDSFAEFQDAATEYGEAELLGLLQIMTTAFVNIDPTAPNVEVKLYNAGKRSKVVMVERREGGATSEQSSIFRWLDGQWLLEW